MKIKFLGASGTVTGSSYVLTSDLGQSILIDLGMFQGPPEIESKNYLPIDCDLSKLSGVILTHAHLDHCGRLPLLIKNNFKENIYMTPATADLVELTLMDSAKVAKEDSSKGRSSSGRKILYNTKDVIQTIKQFVTMDYDKEIHIGDFIIIFKDAGHILGSSSIEIIDKNAKTEFRKIVFSGDLGNSPALLEKETELISSSDCVVMETTYGDRLHPDENPVDAIRSEINAVEISGGTLLIPSFSLDRTQEILHIIVHLKKEGKVLNETPVILDSPMAEKATKIYVEYPKLFNPHVQSDLKLGQLFDFPGLEVTQNWKDSQTLHNRPEAKVIIAGSGMMMGGRIVGHAEFYLDNPSTRLMIAGYQAEGTLGRDLLLGRKKVKASVHDTQGMSSHADQNQLMNWLKNIKGVKKIFLTHGDDSARETFANKIKLELGIDDVILPNQNQEFSISTLFTNNG